VYDASGAKLRKIVSNNGTITTYDYVNGIEYKNNALERIPNTEGAVTKNASGVFEYEYVLRDHLGNTRATFKDGNNDGIVTNADISQINHYYPFGLNMEGNWTPSGANGGGNKYQYNGKEWNDDFGLGWNHHDWRFLDVATNRFVTVDRLSEEEDQEQLTPYQFAYNNPIRYDDPDGQCPTCLIGAIVEGGIELGGQLLSGKSLSEVDWVDVGVEATKGAIKGTGVGFFASEALDIVGEGIKASTDISAKDGVKTVFNDTKSKKEACATPQKLDSKINLI
jgi:RHS repeat-associated protein